MRARALRRLAAALALVTALGAVLAITAFGARPTCWVGDVSAETWASASKDDRWDLAVRIDACGELDGATRAEIKALLAGPGARSNTSDGRSAWVYSLGASPDYADPGRRSLEIVFERERAEEVEARDTSGD